MKAIPSLVKACEECSFPPSSWESGFREMYEMYTLVKSTVDPSPMVVDADDLLDDPKHIMEVYCAATGLPFKESMITWEPKSFPEWEYPSLSAFMVWHGITSRSTGFVKPLHSSVSVDTLEQDVRGMVEEAIPFYEAMYEAKIV